MKTILSLQFCLLLGISALIGQSFDYGNDWYQTAPNQTYIKLVVETDGIYRVSNQDLLDSGFDLSSVDTRMLRLYYRGKEVPLYVSGNGSSLNYLEFLGKRNDGKIDSMMYRDPITGLHAADRQPNKAISIFSDESAYFLTWGTLPSGSRYFSVLDPTYSLFTPEPSFQYEGKLEYLPGVSAEYINGGGGSTDAFFTLNSDYITGEGYIGPRFFPDNPVTATISTPAPANNGTPVSIQARVFGRSNTAHSLRIDLNGDANNPVIDSSINTNALYIKTFLKTLNGGAILSETTDLTFHAVRVGTDNNHVCWSSIQYDRLPDLAGDSAMIIKDWNKGAKAYLRLENAVGTDSVIVYDPVNRIRHKGLIEEEGGTKVAKVIVLGFANERDLILATDAAIRTPVIESAALNKLHQASAGADFVIVTHRDLSASAEAYAAYRDTAQTNPVSARVVYTDEIYDEFGYGTITPWAIKRFCKYALDNWNRKPKYFLFWGKGKYRTRGNESLSMVPTYGYPATDYEFVGHFNPNDMEVNPQASVGRVNVYSNEEGFAYLAKVNAYEHTPWQPWMKRGVFLGGGGTLGEQSSIRSTFDFMVDIFEDIPFGGSTYRFQKDDNSTQLDPNAASYHDEIDMGVSIIHFFGHSTSNIQDINIRPADQYENFDRYPLMVAMGCYGGDFTVNGSSFGELWIKTPNRGAIGYLANSSAGYLNPLRDYGRVLYRYLYTQGQNEAIGDILRETFKSYEDSLLGIQYRNHSRQLNLQGDPAVRLAYPSKPDVEITNSSIFFTPEEITAQDDSFRINIIVNNLGLAVKDSISISVNQRLPNGNVHQHPVQLVPTPLFVDTISFILKNPVGNGMTGQNIFEVFVDSKNVLDEYREDNNRINHVRIVPGNIPAVLYPVEYAVIGDNQVSLQASAFFMTRDEAVKYIYEIDTTHTFDSPLKANSGVVEGTAIFSSWTAPFTLEDSTVYYWRVRLAEVSPVSWAQSSFKYIANRKGWAQADLKQFEKDALTEVSLNTLQQEWEFGAYAADYEFSTGEGDVFIYNRNGSLVLNLYLNGFFVDGLACVILDQYTLEPVVRGRYGEVIPARAPGQYHTIRDAILNAREGDYVMVASHLSGHISQWPDDLFAALEEIGVSSNIRLLNDGDPFLVMGRKGYPNSATEIYTNNSGTRLVLRTRLIANRDRGQISSTVVGPALDWNQLFWSWDSKDVVVQENAQVSVVGIGQNGMSDTVLISQLNEGSFDVSGIDAAAYPYLRLEADLVDSITRTAPQLADWHLLFTPAPDAVVDPLVNFSFQKDTVYEGENIFIHLGARNISATDMDSVLVYFTLERADRSRLLLDSLRIAPLLVGGESIEFEYEFNTLNKNLEGDVQLIVEINPNNEQAEQYAFNNLYIQPFHVLIDRLNPIMDVTFDGKHIIDGDIVSPEPEIVIEINDENTFVPVTDPDAFELSFKKGTNIGVPFEPIYANSGQGVTWEPAELPDNKAKLYFYPAENQAFTETGKLEDGEYTLRVQGRDQHGNAAGRGENYYEIRFRVDNQSSITHVLNYPNPFSTSTKFVYTLTGAELPEVFQIHIYTISGKMIKLIDLVELGDVHVGRNITEYAWDGTDEYGDYVANGVYLYRTVIKMPSEDLELRGEETEQFFNKGWGKMYLMR
ncbi:MAG: C25 family cysteine peptidase [Bacteroidota bacterium]